MNIDITQKIQKLLQDYPVILFMKGDKYFPKCGYSRTVVEILNNYDVDFATYDILEDQELREALKSFSNWPTYPQLYIKSELIGGADIVSEIHLNGELESLLN